MLRTKRLAQFINQAVLPLTNNAMRKKVEAIAENEINGSKLVVSPHASFLILKDLGPEPLLKRAFIQGSKPEELVFVFDSHI